jgi:hypothetical protein|nr:acetate--CoA ligase family protein [Kofleriaceae bacterium]
MAQARVAADAPVAVRVVVHAPAGLAATALAALAVRGITGLDAIGATESARGDAARDAVAHGDLLAWAFDEPPSAAAVVELAPTCAAGAAAGRPVCVLAPLARGSGRIAIERAAALAYLRAHGAAVAHDVDAWLEAVVLAARFGVPAGPRAAVIAAPGSWLAAQAHALVAEAELAGARPLLSDDDEPTDAVLFEAPTTANTNAAAPRAGTAALRIPVAPLGELAGDAVALHGARAAVLAVGLLGRAAQRAAIGLGPAPREAAAELAIDTERLARQLDKLARLGTSRAGDHETKVLLAAYRVPHTKQAVATTPSAAVTKARALGFPVELKPYGDTLPTEAAGCPVERDVSSDAMVRRAYAAVLAAAGRGDDMRDTAVIVREAVQPGRDLAVSFVKLPALGWTVVLDAPGAAQVAAAPAPLRLVDANALAAQVVASRVGEPDPDRSELANLLRRASHLVVDLDAKLVRLDLPRVVVGGRGARTLVVDCFCELA